MSESPDSAPIYVKDYEAEPAEITRLIKLYGERRNRQAKVVPAESPCDLYIELPLSSDQVHETFSGPAT
jgi:hypothetical protein